MPCQPKYGHLAVFESKNGKWERGTPLETQWGLGIVRTKSGVGSAPCDVVAKVGVDPLMRKIDPWGQKHVRRSHPLLMTRVQDNNDNPLTNYEVTITDDDRTTIMLTLPSGYVYEQELSPQQFADGACLGASGDDDSSVVLVLTRRTLRVQTSRVLP